MLLKTVLRSSKYRIWLSCGFLFFICLLAILFTFKFVNFYKFIEPKNDPGTVALSFTESLQTNNYRRIQVSAATALWPQLEQWMSNHEAINCPASFEEHSMVASGTMVPDERNNSSASFNVTIVLPCPQPQWYCLRVEEILLNETENGWLVIEWGEIEEKFQENPFCFT